MNQLSWLIYLADVANSAEGWFVFFGWVCSVVSVITILIMAGVQVFVGHHTNEKGQTISPEKVEETLKDKRDFIKGAWKLVGGFLPTAVFFIVLTVLIPSRDTMYAIAASEFGEEVIQSPLVGKAGRALEAWLDEQLAPDEPAAT